MGERFKILPLILISICVMAGCEREGEQSPPHIVKGDLGYDLVYDFETYLLKLLEDFDYQSSFAIGVTQGSEIVYAKAFGYANMQTLDTVDLETIYHMASVSKPFVATAIMQLVENGLIDLDDRLVDHMAYFHLAGGDYKNITVRQVLTHTSGLPDVKDYHWETPTYSEDALKQYVQSISNREMIANPGEDFAYSNLAFDCLGALIAEVSGLSFADYVQENILNPIGMRSSSFLMPRDFPENWASPHVTILQPELWPNYPYNRMHGPSSTLHANILDMCQWGIWNIHQGQIAGRDVLSKENYNQLINPSLDLPWGEQIGLSWYLGEHKGIQTIRHTGADDGFRSRFLMVPELGISISIMANQSDAPITQVLNAIMSVVFEEEIAPYKIPARMPVSKELSENGFEAAKALWLELKVDSSQLYQVDEDQLNDLGYVLLGSGQFELAKEIFQLNIEAYPNSANVYDSYGEAHLYSGDTAAAILSFQDALTIDPNFGASLYNLEKLDSK